MRATKRTLIPLRQSASLCRCRPDRTWAVSYPGKVLNGRQEVARRFFRLKSDAEAFCAIKRSEIASLGVLADSLSSELKREALDCSGKLKPFGVSLTAAVDWFIKSQPAGGAKVSILEAMKALQSRIIVDGYSKRHSQLVGQIVSSFGRGRMDALVSSITERDAQAWLDGYRTKEGQPLSVVAFNTYRRYLSVFFNYCLKRGLVSANPLSRVGTRKVLAKVPRLLSPDDLRVILDAATECLKPVLAIQALSGLRVAEAARLRWSDVLWTENGSFIRIGADTAKTSRRRLAPVPDSLAGYLRGISRCEGFVYSPGKGSVDALQKATVGFRRSLFGVAWGRNALRASALSYRLALTRDAAATAFEMGNSPTILMRDYRELTTASVAKEWFSVLQEVKESQKPLGNVA
jgi:integrase